MTEKELRKLSRLELLEMLVEQSRLNRSLQTRLDEQETQHQTRLTELEALHQTRLRDQEALYRTRLNDLAKGFQEKIETLQGQLDAKILAIDEAGSLADACLKINGVFEAAQAAAGQYLSNIRRREEQSRTSEQVSGLAKDAEAEAREQNAQTLPEQTEKPASEVQDTEFRSMDGMTRHERKNLMKEKQNLVNGNDHQ